MIIDRTARVVPPRYADKAISRTMGDLIGKADRDGLLATLLWAGECRIAQQVEAEWRQHTDRLRREQEEAERRKGPAYLRYYVQTPMEGKARIQKECRDAAVALHEQITSELQEAEEAAAECEQTLFELTRWLGRPLDERKATEHSRGFVLDELAPLDNQLQQARQRLTQLLAEDREKLHELALQNLYQQQYAATDAKESLAVIDRMTPPAFTRLVRERLEAEGCTAVETATAESSILVMHTAGGRAVVVSTHRFLEPASGSRPELPLAALRRARHAADQAGAEAVVVAVNGYLTWPAHRYAAANAMILLERDDLEIWAIWRRPLDLDHRLPDVAEK